MLVLIDSLYEITGHTRIKCAITFIRHDINCWMTFMHLLILLKWIFLFLQTCFAVALQKYGLLHPTKNVGFAMTKLSRKNRKFLQRWPIVGVVRLESENNQYKIKINKK